MKKQLFVAAMVIAASVVAPIRADIIEQVLVKVNGEIITKTELEQRQGSVLRQKMQGQQVDPESLKNDETLKKALAEVTPQLLVNAIDGLLLLQRGRAQELERQMLIEQVQRQEVGSKLSITEEEAGQYYAKHPEEFTESAAVTLREIFIEVPAEKDGVSVAKDDETKKRIEDIRARVLKGEDFAKLAAEVSSAASKAHGGVVGTVAHPGMVS